jgi:type IV secretion system protein VirD4
MANILKQEPTLNEFIRDKFRQHIGREEKARQSFESHVITALDAWNNSLVDAATSRSDFNIANLRRKPFTILIGTPIGNFGTVEAVVRLLIQQVHDVLLKSLPGLDEPHRLLLMLDEFFQFGRMPEIVDRSPLVAGYGFQIAVIAQGLTQLDVRYGRPTRDMMIANMDVKLLIGVGDEVTASYCSEELGDQYVRHEGWGTSKGLRGGAQTRQGRWELEPIMPGDTMRRLDPRKAVLLLRGHPGAVIDKAFLFRDRAFMRQILAARPFANRLTIPKIGAVHSQSSAPSTPKPRGALKHEIARTRVMDAARDLFKDATRLEGAFLAAMGAASNDAVAGLCQQLRTEPAKLGELRDRKRSRFRRTEPPDVLTLRLRTEIIAARRLLNDSRAEFVTAALRMTGAERADDPAACVPDAASTDKTASAAGSAKAAETDLVSMVASLEAHSGAMAEYLVKNGQLTSKGAADERLTGYALELEKYVGLFLDTPEDLANVMTE